MNEHHLLLAGFAMWVPEIGGFMAWGSLMSAVVHNSFPPGSVPIPEPRPGEVYERTLCAEVFDHPYSSETLQ